MWLLLFMFLSSMCGASTGIQQADGQNGSPIGKGKTFEIRGKVIEPGLNQPIHEVLVTLTQFPDDGPIIITPLKPGETVGSTNTRIDGTFVFVLPRAGRYNVEIHKDGYTHLGGVLGRDRPATAVLHVTEKQQVAEVALFLVRPAVVTGRVVDWETGKPAAGIPLRVWQAVNRAGRRIVYRGATTTSESDGKFSASGLWPGEYIVEVQSSLHKNDRALKEFSAEDKDIVDRDYENSFWPGGGDKQSAMPLTVFSGGTADFGTLAIRRTDHYRVLLDLVQPVSCPTGAQIMVSEHAGDGWNIEIGVFPCGRNILIRGFVPGSHELEFNVQGVTRESRLRDVIPFSISRRGAELTPILSRGLDVAGRFVPGEGSRVPDLSTLAVRLQAVGLIQWLDEREMTRPAADGRFMIPNLAPARHRVIITGLEATHYIQQLRYNGTPIEGSFLHLNRAAIDHSLLVVVDDKPATLTGQVTDGDEPVTNAHVVLARWPVVGENMHEEARTIKGDDEGRFSLAGLAPGDYRIVAGDALFEAEIQKPLILEGFLRSAKTFTLSPGGTLNLQLKKTSP